MGFVYLIGAGPGDPELLTIKAARALRRCDVILIDALVDRRLLGRCRRGVRVIDVGKRGGCRSVSQDTIATTLVRLARHGHTVGRLKGGDPLVFGRGAEEADALRAAGIRFTIISGVTAGVAVPTAAGIAVTRRAMARGAVFVTGHASDDGGEVDWAALARTGLTLVVFMGHARVAAIADGLRAGGLADATPAAAIQDGTLATQRVVRTTLGALPRAVVELRPPVLLVIGAVASDAAAVCGSRVVAQPDTQRDGAVRGIAGRSRSVTRA